jgi:DNA helicase-2/ATP-dependent DNA helicase PcrA
MWIGTFHSIFARILRIGAEAIGFTHNFTIYDETDSKNLLAKCIEELNFNNKVLSPSMAREVISRAKNSAVMPQDFSTQFADVFRYEQIGRIYALYQQKLKDNNAMDFDDLLLNTLKLFKENEDILAYYQDRFVHILVDEYQDTNALQYEILAMIAKKHGNICVCGDDDQSIYGWRGADIRNILEFENDFPDAKVIRLEQNLPQHRQYSQCFKPCDFNNENRKGKTLWTDKGDGDKIRFICSARDFDEAERIAYETELLVKQGKSYSDIAILTA